MKKRYCQTLLQRYLPCDVGWGEHSSGGTNRNCFDEPMGKNCKYIVETKDLKCPVCGNNIERRGK